MHIHANGPYSFPFGRPIVECSPPISGPRLWYILGAYPSALHIRWTPPRPYAPVQSLAVDNEPEIWWDGSRQLEYIAAWKEAVGFQQEWGQVGVAKQNGPSGQWLNAKVLAPLGLRRGEIWLSDCLTTYRPGDDQRKRWDGTCAAFAAAYRLPAPQAEPHPSERDIVNGALTTHRERLRGEFRLGQPEHIITLGNAALTVFRALAAWVQPGTPDSLRHALGTSTYGKAWSARLDDGRRVHWYPLAHPAAPVKYQSAHVSWMQSVGQA
jgi:hypothetical protein